ncbi:hypothetical protein EJ04DRAFT_567496 [Polyplosphaeria fusca]|uniref:Heterokaryon incompatibility domain-containing protein n=1 Tax=Polyplosphaeria fusca TaxID=682080 RepID=A0A9P4QNK2_9PLEO|nr:hypothetical protein EJ04DRAFT_567496 [Polyplosphaeria fusca]
MRFRSILSHARVTQNLHFLLGTATYRYRPLPTATSIRLLELKPSPDKRSVLSSLKTYELHHAPPFQALSYTWGNPYTTLPKPAPSSPGKHRRIDPSVQELGSSLGHANEVLWSTRRKAYVCDGQIINITPNLRDALRMLSTLATSSKASGSPGYYWIDSLCMNQENVAERNAQVSRMSDIFKAADSVIVWLGKEDESVPDAITTMERISQTPEDDWPFIPYTSFYENANPGKGPNISYHNWLGLIALLERPWFKRAWVVQEIALAKNAIVYCGRYNFSWEILSKSLSFIKATKFYHHLQTEKMKHINAVRTNPGIYKRVLQARLGISVGSVYLDVTRIKLNEPDRSKHAETGVEANYRPPLRLLMDTHRFSKSTDPRDKVYAFLGLADRRMAPFRSHPDVLKPDYSLSVQQVYLEAAQAIMVSYRNLSLLSHVQDASRTRIPGLPSWVPDYSVTLDPYPLRFRGPGHWKAAGKLGWDPNVFSMSQGLLDVQGYQLDHVDQVATLVDESDDASASWASIVKLGLSLELPYPNPARKKQTPSRVEVLWRTLTTDIYNKTYPAPEHTGSLFIDYILNLQIRHRLTPWSKADEFQPYHSPVSDLIYPEWDTLLRLEPPGSPYSTATYKQRLSTIIGSMFKGTYTPIGLQQLQHEFDQGAGKNRRLFKTRTGYLGTGSRSLAEGDEVWILHSGNLPLILRRLSNGHHQLVGEAFVYGLMHGEFQGLELPRRQVTIE